MAYQVTLKLIKLLQDMILFYLFINLFYFSLIIKQIYSYFFYFGISMHQKLNNKLNKFYLIIYYF